MTTESNSNKPSVPTKYMVIAALVIVFIICGSTYNSMMSSDEDVTTAWSEVINMYQRQNDLIPNLVKSVSAYAQHERDTLTEVTAARSAISNFKVTSDIINNPEQLKQFEQVQKNMAGALSKLMLVVEKYPDLKADKQFEKLNDELAGSQNRISTARTRYIKVVNSYNKTVRNFPNNIIAQLFNFNVKPNFTVEDEKAVSKAPDIQFPNVSKKP